MNIPGDALEAPERQARAAAATFSSSVISALLRPDAFDSILAHVPGGGFVSEVEEAPALRARRIAAAPANRSEPG